MGELIMDGESDIATDEAARYNLRRNGITYVPRALKQKVFYIDRRGALLRDTVHRVFAQSEQEGISVEFKFISEGVHSQWKRFVDVQWSRTLQCSLWRNTGNSSRNGCRHRRR